eukprot:13903405-Ditylum_brightwellii.AAC.1
MVWVLLASVTRMELTKVQRVHIMRIVGLMKKKTKHQRRRCKLRVLTETVKGMTVTATSMTVTGMAVMAHIPCLVL